VAGFDNIAVASLIDPPLTTVNISKYQMGYEAAELLVDRILHPDRPAETRTLDSNLIIRRSTDPRRGNEWDLFGW
jgi:DNA-binding LacI/PurR family transcriptional regulator